MNSRQPYLLADGTRVPGVTTILGKFRDPGALMFWAWKEGCEGRDFRQSRDDAADSGTMAHRAVEMWIKGQIPTFGDGEVSKRAQMAFEAFLEWAEQSALRVDETEVRMISERHRFGGTCDGVLLGNRRAIVDWKSSNGIYGDMLCQVAAYKELWNETHADQIDGGLHIVRFDKEFGDFHHHYWAELDAAWEMFLHLRAAYDLEQIVRRRAK